MVLQATDQSKLNSSFDFYNPASSSYKKQRNNRKSYDFEDSVLPKESLNFDLISDENDSKRLNQTKNEITSSYKNYPQPFKVMPGLMDFRDKHGSTSTRSKFKIVDKSSIVSSKNHHPKSEEPNMYVGIL